MANMRPFGLLAGADPFRELRRLQDEMNSLVGTLVPGAGLAAAGGFPAVNVYAGRDGIAVVAELPGIAKEDLEIQAHRDTLTDPAGAVLRDPVCLRAPVLGRTRQAAPAASEESAYHRRERRSGTFSRTIQLPYRVDPDRVQAQLEDGVLRLSLPRPEEDKPRRITVSG